jgi:S1-C subfamily serine protease
MRSGSKQYMTGSGNIQERNGYLTAILTLPALALTGGALGLLKSGDVVISIGSPFYFEQSVTSGIVSSRNRNLNAGGMVYENLIKTDSAINKGSSGGRKK